MKVEKLLKLCLTVYVMTSWKEFVSPSLPVERSLEEAKSDGLHCCFHHIMENKNFLSLFKQLPGEIQELSFLIL